MLNIKGNSRATRGNRCVRKRNGNGNSKFHCPVKKEIKNGKSKAK